MIARLGAGIVVFLWSRELFGVIGGLVSLALFCVSPNLLAHAHLATIDMGFTALVVTSSYLLWRWVGGGWRFGPGMAFMLVLAGAIAAKFTAVLLVPVYAILSFVPLRNAKGSEGSVVSGKAIVGTWLAVALLAVVIVNSLFAWEGVGGLSARWASGVAPSKRSPAAPDRRFQVRFPDGI